MNWQQLLQVSNRAVFYAFAIVGALFLAGVIAPIGVIASVAESHGQSIRCDSNHAQLVRVAAKSITTLSFPVKPKDIIPGENAFDFHRIGGDLIIKPLKPGAETNVLVYMSERRCAFQLKTVSGPGDGILTVEDPEDKLFEARFK